jgi:T5SS/PEP-CTERM-associated repeat protein
MRRQPCSQVTRPRRIIGVLLSGVAVACWPSVAFAGVTTWVASAGGAWDAPDNWSDGVPASDDSVVFPPLGTTYAVTLPASASVADVLVTGPVRLVGGSLSMPGGLRVEGADAALALEAGTVVAHLAQIGDGPGTTGSLTLSDGAMLTTSGVDRVGIGFGSMAEVAVIGAGTTWTSTGTILVGLGGAATLSASSSGRFVLANAIVDAGATIELDAGAIGLAAGTLVTSGADVTVTPGSAAPGSTSVVATFTALSGTFGEIAPPSMKGEVGSVLLEATALFATVPDPAVALAIEPAAIVTHPGFPRGVEAIAVRASGGHQAVDAAWTIGDTGIVDLSLVAPSSFTGIAPGSTQVTANWQGLEALAVVTVLPLPTTYDVERVSVASDGTEANGASGATGQPGFSTPPRVVSMSADGRIVAFASDATNLVGRDANGVADVFVKDLDTGLVVRIGPADGSESDGPSLAPRLSADGRFVVFQSSATNLVPGIAVLKQSVYRFDRTSGVIELVSVGLDGAMPNGVSTGGSISADGRAIAFGSGASNLVVGDTNQTTDVFVRDLAKGTTVRASVGPAGQQSQYEGYVDYAFISGSGLRVVMASSDAALTGVPLNPYSQVLIKDLVTGAISLVSHNAQGAIANQTSIPAWIDFDGEVAAFFSSGTSLLPGQVSGPAQSYLGFFDGSAAELLTLSATGGVPNGYASVGCMSEDLRYAFFLSPASNIEGNSGAFTLDLFRRDRCTGRTERLSKPPLDLLGEAGSAGIACDVRGAAVAFVSGSRTFVAWDTNETSDVFLRGLLTSRADLNGDGLVSAADLAELLGAWGSTDACVDLDGDGLVGASDLAALLGDWDSSEGSGR